MKKLSRAQVKRLVSGIKGWSIIKKSIRKDFLFKDFKVSMTFVLKVARLAERHDHHPVIIIDYDKVSLEFTTHSAGGLTAKDFSMARSIDSI